MNILVTLNIFTTISIFFWYDINYFLLDINILNINLSVHLEIVIVQISVFKYRIVILIFTWEFNKCDWQEYINIQHTLTNINIQNIWIQRVNIEPWLPVIDPVAHQGQECGRPMQGGTAAEIAGMVCDLNFGSRWWQLY